MRQVRLMWAMAGIAAAALVVEACSGKSSVGSGASGAQVTGGSQVTSGAGGNPCAPDSCNGPSSPSAGTGAAGGMGGATAGSGGAGASGAMASSSSASSTAMASSSTGGMVDCKIKSAQCGQCLMSACKAQVTACQMDAACAAAGNKSASQCMCPAQQANDKAAFDQCVSDLAAVDAAGKAFADCFKASCSGACF